MLPSSLPPAAALFLAGAGLILRRRMIHRHARHRRLRDLRGVIVVVRHGARGPSNGALGKLPVSKKEWAAEEAEELTGVGVGQLEALGTWFWDEYVVRQNPGLRSGSLVKWRTSPVARVEKSGTAFMQGFRAAGGQLLGGPAQAQPYGGAGASEEDQKAGANAAFRSWNADKGYKAFASALRKGPAFEAKAAEHAAFLEKLRDRLDLGADRTHREVLDATTYMKEVWDCELFWREPGATREAVLKRLGGPGGPEAGGGGDLRAMKGLAKWAWDQRFFAPDWGQTIGGPLLREIVNDAETIGSAAPGVELFFGHDYSILALMAAMGIPHYPTPGDDTLEFAAHLIFEVWDEEDVQDGSKGNEGGNGAGGEGSEGAGRSRRMVRVILNPEPFTAEGGGCGPVQVDRSFALLGGDIALDQLRQLAAS